MSGSTARYRALICSGEDLGDELSRTLLFRGDFERHTAARVDEALVMALAAQPTIVVVDRTLPRAEQLVTGLRQEPATRKLSIVIVARGDFEPAEVDLLEAGANAILRLPPGAEWDARLVRLLDVPARKDARFAVQFEVEGKRGIEKIPALALNLSPHGMLVESSVSLSVGEETSLVFRLPSTSAAILGRGLIVRRAGPTHYGLEFFALERGSLQRIEAFLASLPGAL